MSWGSERSSRVRTIDVIVALVTVSFVAFLFVDIAIEAKLLIIVVFGVLGFLNFVAYVGLLDRWKRAWQSFAREREIRHHPDLVNELYRLHDRIERVLYRRESGKPSLGLNVVEMMNEALHSKENETNEFTEKFAMITRRFNWITQRVKDHREGRKSWTSPDFANVVREIGDHLLDVNDVLETVYRTFPKSQGIREDLNDSWESFRDEYATLIREWQSFTERVDETIGYGTKRTIPPPRRLS